MSELIMNENGTIDYGSTSSISGGTISIITPPSIKNIASGYGIYRGPINGTVSGANASGFVSGSVVGTWTISPTATKCLADSLPVVRARDTGTIVATGTPTGGGSAPVPGGTVEVADAGQTKAFAE